MALVLERDSNLISDKDLEKAKNQKWAVNTKIRSLSFFREFVKWRYKKNDDRLKKLTCWLPELKGVKDQNPKYPYDLGTWFRFVTFVRDAIVHQDFMVNKAEAIEIDKALWSKTSAMCAYSFAFRPKISSAREKFKITLDEGEAKRDLGFFLEYAFAIYKAASIKNGLEWNYFDWETLREIYK